jgi:hypothetical protein
MVVKRTRSHVVSGPDNDSTKGLIRALELTEQIVEGLMARTMTKEKAMELINQEFPQHQHWPEDREWTGKWMPWIIDRILEGKMSEDEASFNICSCIL